MIFINGKFLTQRMTGVQRFAYELTKRLIELDKDVTIVVPYSVNIDSTGFLPKNIIKVRGFKNTVLWEQFNLPLFLRKQHNSLLISLCNTGPITKRNQIICIHDMATFENPKWFSISFALYYRLITPVIAKVSKHVITVSRFSKNEISEKLKLPSSKISVVYNAPSEKFKCKSIEHINYKKDDYFLFVGSLDPRKNLNILIKTFSEPEFKNIELKIVGAKSRTFKTEKFQLTPNITILDNCDDSCLSRLYKNAKALINSSLYEGFGLPLVEAMASGCPLILSDIPVYKEIAAGNADFFDPESLESIKEVLSEFLNRDKNLVNSKIRDNYLLSLKFDWQKSSVHLLNIIKK